MASKHCQRKPTTDALRRARAAALLEIIGGNERNDLWLEDVAWRRLRRLGLSRRYVERAIADLAADGLVSVAQAEGYVIVTLAKRRAGE